MGLDGYTGPTSGRITIGGGSDPTVTHESFTQESDPLLTRDELNATADFRALPPNAQIREVRVMKWNLAERQSKIDSMRDTIRRQDAEIQQLSQELARITPEGYEIPLSASLLIAHAEAHGWKTGRAWTPERTDPEQEEETGAGRRLDVHLGNGIWTFKLAWGCLPGGGGQMIRSGLARGPRRPWQDAPSLKRIKEIITDSVEGQDAEA